MLNRNDAVPLYIQIQRILRQKIMNGTYRKGDMIPSETQLMRMFNVTRTTVRRAIADLVNEGLLKKVHGKGTFVNLQEVKHSIWNFSGFTDFANRKNETPVTKVLQAHIESEGEEAIYKLVRLRGIVKEGTTQWMTLDTSRIPLFVFPGIDKYDFSQESLYRVMKSIYCMTPKTASLSVLPITGTEEMKQLFSYQEDIPLLKAKGEVYSEDGTVVEWAEVIFGPNVEFKIMTNTDL